MDISDLHVNTASGGIDHAEWMRLCEEWRKVTVDQSKIITDQHATINRMIEAVEKSVKFLDAETARINRAHQRITQLERSQMILAFATLLSVILLALS